MRVVLVLSMVRELFEMFVKKDIMSMKSNKPEKNRSGETDRTEKQPESLRERSGKKQGEQMVKAAGYGPSNNRKVTRENASDIVDWLSQIIEQRRSLAEEQRAWTHRSFDNITVDSITVYPVDSVTVNVDNEQKMEQYRDFIKRDLITNRAGNDVTWENYVKKTRERLVRSDMRLAGRITSELTPIGQEYSSNLARLNDSRNTISEEAYREQELTLRANFHADRLLALEKIEDEIDLAPRYV